MTLLLNEKVAIHADFNPHFRKGSDRSRSFFALEKADFNPHFRKGSDEPLLLSDPLLTISIHTSAREVTTLFNSFIYFFLNFNPHFRKGSDVHSRPALSTNADFNPHFRKGSDPIPICFLLC